MHSGNYHLVTLPYGTNLPYIDKITKCPHTAWQ